MASRAAPVTLLPNHLAITPGTDIYGVWIDPVEELITGKLREWADKAEVTSIRIPGYWTHKKGSDIEPFSSPQPGEKIVYALHGGAYVRLSGHPTDVTGNIGKGFLQYVDKVTRVFSTEYRLAVGKPNIPQHSFPTQLIDALAGYNYLVNVVGFSPEDIIVEGDSAGGNLAHALTRYLVEYQGNAEVKLPGPPSALILTSPWADLGEGHETLPNGSAKKFLGQETVHTQRALSRASMDCPLPTRTHISLLLHWIPPSGSASKVSLEHSSLVVEQNSFWTAFAL